MTSHLLEKKGQLMPITRVLTQASPPRFSPPSPPPPTSDVKRFSTNSPCAHVTRGSQTSHMPQGTTPRTLCVSFKKSSLVRFSLLNLTRRLLTRTRLALTRGSELSRTRERDADGDAFFECVRDRVRACVTRALFPTSLSRSCLLGLAHIHLKHFHRLALRLRAARTHRTNDPA